MPDTTAVVRRPEQVPGDPVAPGVTAAQMLNDEHGCRGLHQRRLRFSGGATLTGTAGGRGEAWYVIRGSGELDVTAGDGRVASERCSLVLPCGWSRGRVTGARAAGTGRDGELEVLAITVRAETGEGPGLHASSWRTARWSGPGTGSSGCC